MSTRGLHWAWVILAVCFADLFVNYSVRLGFGVLLPEMIRALELNRTQGGAIFNFYLAAYICLTPLAGNLTDRLGARWVIASAGVVLGGGTLLLGSAQGFWTACAFFALAGAGAAGIWTPVLTVVQRWFAPRRRGLALGILSTGYGLGLAAMGQIFPVLVEAYSWRLCWSMLGALALGLIVANALLLRSGPEERQVTPWGAPEDAHPAGRPTGGATRPDANYGEVFGSPSFWIIGASYFFAACALYLVTTFMVDYAQGERGLGFGEASFLATLHGLGQVAGVLTIPLLSDRVGRRATLVGTNLCTALSIGCLLVWTEGLWGLYGGVTLLGLVYGPTWPLYGACGGDYFKKEVMGTVIGFWTPFYGLGAIAAHFIGGGMRDATQSFQGAFAGAMVLAVLAALLMGRMPGAVGRSQGAY
jgi:MFS family permease